MKIGIAGVGGIGSNVAFHLIRSGIQKLKIVDYDRVEASNLNRQFYFADQIGQPKVEVLTCNLKRIVAQIEVEALMLRLDRDNVAATFSDCAIVVEGFDGQADKKMLMEAMADTHQFIISASGVAGHHMDQISVRSLGRCTVVGDFKTDCRHAELYSHKVGVIAAMMAGLVLERRCDVQQT